MLRASNLKKGERSVLCLNSFSFFSQPHPLTNADLQTVVIYELLCWQEGYWFGIRCLPSLQSLNESKPDIVSPALTHPQCLIHFVLSTSQLVYGQPFLLFPTCSFLLQEFLIRM